MLQFDPALQATLDASPTKLAWSNSLNTALTATRRIRCYRDSNASASDPAATGVEFWNIGNTGPLLSSGGNISSFGTLTTSTVRLAANLLTGKSVLIIEGGGHYIKGTLGLTRAAQLAAGVLESNLVDYDFTFSANPTGNSGLSAAAGVRAPRLLPSGTGPLVPPSITARPYTAELWDWTTPATPVLRDTCTLDTRLDDLVWEDTELASETGDIKIMQCSKGLIWGKFQWGVTSFAVNQVINEVAQAPVHQVLVNCRPYGRWETYPASDTFQEMIYSVVSRTGTGNSKVNWIQPYTTPETVTLTALTATTFSVVGSVHGAYPNLTIGEEYRVPGIWASIILNPETTPIAHVAGDTITITASLRLPTREIDTTVPPAFKILLKDVSGNVLHTFQMRDGLPINSPLMSQIRTASQPLRPFWNCAMMLGWSSAETKPNSRRNKYHPGIVASYRRPTMARQGASTNAPVPMIAGRTQINSMSQWYAAPRWPLGGENTPANDALDPNNDPYIYNLPQYFTSTIVGATTMLSRAFGWDYEPGSISNHDWYTGPGGPRIDRAPIPAPTAEFLSDPSGIRLRDGFTWRQTNKGFVMAYLNHSHHHFLDAPTFKMFENADTVYGKWAFGGGYYGSNPDGYVPGGRARHVAQRAIPSGASSPLQLDAQGNPTWNGWALDNLHSYCQPGLAVLFLNSPMFIVSAKTRFQSHMMCQQAANDLNSTSGFMERNGAWRWWQWAVMWKLGTEHQYGIPRAMIEDRWRMDMEAIYAIYALPATDPTHPEYMSDDSRCLRALGQRRSGLPARRAEDNSMESYTVRSNGLAFYMGTVILMMVQTGSWDVMYAKNDRCKAAMDFLVDCLDRFSIDFIMDTDGRAEVYIPIAPATLVSANNPSTDFATSWKDWNDRLFPIPNTNPENWVVNVMGAPRGSSGIAYEGPERDVAQHNRAQWAFLRQEYLRHLRPNPRIDAAANKYQGFYDYRTAWVEAEPNPQSRRNRDWNYLIPSLGRIKPPAV